MGSSPIMYAPPTSSVLVTTSEIESDSEFKTNSSPPSGLIANCSGALPTSSRASRRSGCAGCASERASAIAMIWWPAEQATNVLEESGKDHSIRGTGAAIESLERTLAACGVNQADRIASLAVGYDQCLSIRARCGRLPAPRRRQWPQSRAAPSGRAQRWCSIRSWPRKPARLPGQSRWRPACVCTKIVTVDGVVLRVNDGNGTLARPPRRS
jgi:hypothetical protein